MKNPCTNPLCTNPVCLDFRKYVCGSLEEDIEFANEIYEEWLDAGSTALLTLDRLAREANTTDKENSNA